MKRIPTFYRARRRPVPAKPHVRVIALPTSGKRFPDGVNSKFIFLGIAMLPNPLPFFIHLPDSRRETRNKRHKVEDIVMITLCAVLGGFEDWTSIEVLAPPPN